MQKPCGLYRTTQPLGSAIPAGVLVYYHNHGDPGPGLYLPVRWENNRASFEQRGTTIEEQGYAETLEPLLPEGFYRVVEDFHCCPQKCKLFEQELLVQLGYNGRGQAIVFVPTLVRGAVALPMEGTLVDDQELAALAALKVPVAANEPDVVGALQ